MFVLSPVIFTVLFADLLYGEYYTLAEKSIWPLFNLSLPVLFVSALRTTAIIGKKIGEVTDGNRVVANLAWDALGCVVASSAILSFLTAAVITLVGLVLFIFGASAEPVRVFIYAAWLASSITFALHLLGYAIAFAFMYVAVKENFDLDINVKK